MVEDEEDGPFWRRMSASSFRRWTGERFEASVHVARGGQSLYLPATI